MIYPGRRGLQSPSQLSPGGSPNQAMRGFPRLNQNDPINAGLVIYWPMDGATISGTTLVDISGNRNNGTLVGSPALVAGSIGQALNFSGGGSVSLPSAAIDFTGAMSWCFRTKTTDTTQTGLVAYNGSFVGWAAGLGYVNGASPGQMGYYSSGSGGGGGGWVGSTSTNYNDGNAHFVCIVFDGSTTISFFKDGVPDGTGAKGPPSSAGGSATISGPANGYLDDMRFYNRALSAAEVLRLYADTSGNLGLVVPARRIVASSGATLFFFLWTDSVATSDATTPTMLATTATTDSAASSDATTGAGRSTAAQADTSATSDAITGAGRSTASQADSVATSDAATGAAQATASQADSAATSDATTPAMKATAALADTVATSDSLTGFTLATALLNDSVVTSDLFAIIASGAFFFNMSDTLSTSDTVSGSAFAVAAIFDAVATSDANSPSARSNYSLSDTVASSDATTYLATLTASLADAIATSDILAFSTGITMIKPFVAPVLLASIFRVGKVASVSRIASVSSITRIGIA